MDSHETKIYIAILIAAGVLGVILVYFIITILRHQRRAVKFHEEKLLAEITTLEKDRSRIVADLHDELGPLLSTVRIQLESLQSPLSDDHVMVEKACGYLDNVLFRIREISNNLMPQALTRKGLLTALREFTDDVNGHAGVRVSLTVPPSLTVSKNHEVHIYRIVQEIINNTIKHANATELFVRIEETPTQLKIITGDDGRGFVPSAITVENIGLGLKNIISRVDIMKGELYLDAAPGKGTLYTIEIPLKHEWI